MNNFSVSDGSQADRQNDSGNQDERDKDDANGDQDVGNLMDGQSVGESGNTPVHKVMRRHHVIR